MNRYDISKFLHVLSVAVWVGGGVMEQLHAFRASRSPNPEELLIASRNMSWASMRLFMPASIAALLFGIDSSPPSVSFTPICGSFRARRLRVVGDHRHGRARPPSKRINALAENAALTTRSCST